MNRLKRTAAATLACALLCVASNAHAHPELDAGKRLTTELEFEPALAAFERALASGSLTREELVELLSERALLLHALHRHNDLVGDFVWLAALDPDHRLDLRAPPELTAIWTSVRDQARGPLGVSLTAQPNQQGEIDATASLTGTVPDGARARLLIRRPGGSFEVVDSAELSEPLPERGVDLYAEAVGLGQVVVARDHGPDEPLHVQPQAAIAPETSEPLEERSSAGRARRRRNWLIGSAATVAVIVVVSAVLAARGGDDERSDRTVLKPMVSF